MHLLSPAISSDLVLPETRKFCDHVWKLLVIPCFVSAEWLLLFLNTTISSLRGSVKLASYIPLQLDLSFCTGFIPSCQVLYKTHTYISQMISGMPLAFYKEMKQDIMLTLMTDLVTQLLCLNKPMKKCFPLTALLVLQASTWMMYNSLEIVQT